MSTPFFRTLRSPIRRGGSVAPASRAWAPTGDDAAAAEPIRAAYYWKSMDPPDQQATGWRVRRPEFAAADGMTRAAPTEHPKLPVSWLVSHSTCMVRGGGCQVA